MRSRLLVIGLCAIVALAGAAQAAEPMRISVSVPGPGAASYFPIDIIPRLGTDREEGVSLQVNHVPGGGVAIEELVSNNADFAVVGLPAAMSARLKDRRIIALAAVNDLPLYVLLVREALRGQVKSPADLKGRTVGVHSNSLASKTNSHQLLELVLRQHGVAPDDIRVVTVGQRWQSEVSMLKTGAADAVMGDEPHASRMIAGKVAYSLMHLGEPGVADKLPGGGFLRGALIGRSDRLEQDPTRAEAMVRVIRRTLKWLAEHSPEEIVARAGIEDPEERRHFLATLKRFPRQYSKDARFSTRQLKETEVFFHASQAANPAARALAIESMIVDRFAGRKE